MNLDETRTIPRITPPWPFEAYAHIISPLPAEEGGGFLITFPDIPGCMSDGATEAEAVCNGRDAFAAVVSALHDAGRDIPAPAFRPETVAVPSVSGKFVARIPKTTHALLAARATAEGVSMNTLVLAFIAEGLGRRIGKESAQP
jgi:antitoxin HicB